MKIGLSTATFNTAGAFILNIRIDDSEVSEFSRRTNKVATLDGGVVVTDFGYSKGDREFDALIHGESESTLLALRDLMKDYSEFVLCTGEGAWAVNADRFSLANGGVRLKFTAIGQA